MKLVVGLGNPDRKYANTYHNVGFMVADCLAKSLNVKFTKEECLSKVAECKKLDLIIAKPLTYMNLSGEAVKKLVKHYNIDEENDLIVCYDDVDIPIGKLRLREEGSAGTHNGMRNIVEELGTEKFLRLRVGTSTPKLKNGEVKLIDFVLSKIDYEYQPALNVAVQSASKALLELINGTPIARVQEKLNHFVE